MQNMGMPPPLPYLSLSNFADDCTQRKFEVSCITSTLVSPTSPSFPPPTHPPIHHRPTVPACGYALVGIFPEIRRKLAAALVHWAPADAWAHTMLSPWTTVFDSRSMEALLLKSIVPKVVEGVRASLVINPANQVNKSNVHICFVDR